MATVVGVDSSTQSTKLVVCDAETGRVVDERTATHPDGTECPPEVWWNALQAIGRDLLTGPGRVDAIGVAAQQHGMVALDADGRAVRPALLWNDTRSAAAAERLTAQVGAEEFARAVGLVPVASFTLTKLAWLAEHEPELAAAVETVVLPHDYLTWELTGRGEFTTDRGDASGTAYWSPASGEYRTDLLESAFGRRPRLPRVLGPAEIAGRTPEGTIVSAGTGDNMGAALGLGIEPGEVVVSLGTSGTVFAVHDAPTVDPSGIVAGFADATGRYLPLVCTLNAARVLSATAALLGVDIAELDRLALTAEPGAGGLVLLPYLDGERTPNLPDAAGSLHHMRRDAMTPENLARAAVEGMLCGLADGLDALRAQGVRVERVLLIGGAAQSMAVRGIAPMVFGVDVDIPPSAQYVALGAARQAAWALRRSAHDGSAVGAGVGGQAEGGADGDAAEPPRWGLGQVETRLVGDHTRVGAAVRRAYAETRDAIHPATA